MGESAKASRVLGSVSPNLDLMPQQLERRESDVRAASGKGERGGETFLTEADDAGSTVGRAQSDSRLYVFAVCSVFFFSFFPSSQLQASTMPRTAQKRAEATTSKSRPGCRTPPSP